jgi:hypothetical protein
MKLRNVLVTMMVLWLGVIGIICGFLCLTCLVVLLFWQGIGVSTIVLALTCLCCLGLAFLLTDRVMAVSPRARQVKQPSLRRRLWRSLSGSASTATQNFDDQENWQSADYKAWAKRTHKH